MKSGELSLKVLQPRYRKMKRKRKRGKNEEGKETEMHCPLLLSFINPSGKTRTNKQDNMKLEKSEEREAACD